MPTMQGRTNSAVGSIGGLDSPDDGAGLPALRATTPPAVQVLRLDWQLRPMVPHDLAQQFEHGWRFGPQASVRFGVCVLVANGVLAYPPICLTDDVLCGVEYGKVVVAHPTGGRLDCQ